MKPFYDTIYLSPHLDDAALSCGGQIFAATAVNQSVLIVTIMAGDPPVGAESEYIASLHDRWQLVTDAAAARRQEDENACRVLNADFAHWDVPDCIYRFHPVTGQPLYLSDDDIFGGIHPVESGLVEQIAAKLALLPAHNRLVAPLTVGNHVDHQLVRRAAERLGHERLFFYEEFPYVRQSGALEAVVPSDGAGWRSHVIPLRDVDLAARVEAVSAFGSQLSTFFNGRSDLEQQISRYVQRVGGERIWFFRLVQS